MTRTFLSTTTKDSIAAAHKNYRQLTDNEQHLTKIVALMELVRKRIRQSLNSKLLLKMSEFLAEEKALNKDGKQTTDFKQVTQVLKHDPSP